MYSKRCQSLSVWNETQTTHWIIEFGGMSWGDNDTVFYEISESTVHVNTSIYNVY